MTNREAQPCRFENGRPLNLPASPADKLYARVHKIMSALPITAARDFRTFSPRVPQTFEELGIPQSLVMDLMCRRLLLEGFSNLQSLSRKLRLSFPILNAVFH